MEDSHKMMVSNTMRDSDKSKDSNIDVELQIYMWKSNIRFLTKHFHIFSKIKIQ